MTKAIVNILKYTTWIHHRECKGPLVWINIFTFDEYDNFPKKTRTLETKFSLIQPHKRRAAVE